MKPPICKNKIIIDPLFTKEVFFIFGTPEYAKQKAELKYKKDFDFQGFDGSVDSIENKGIVQYVLFINSSSWNYTIYNYSVLAHEIFHLIFRIQQYAIDVKSFSITDDLQEHSAYLLFHPFRYLELLLAQLPVQ